MDDLFEMNEAEDKGMEQDAGAARRRRTMRTYDPVDSLPPPEETAVEAGDTVVVPPVTPAAEKPAAAEDKPAARTKLGAITMSQPAVKEEMPQPVKDGGTRNVPRFETRYQPPVPGAVPSQGVPKPAVLSGQPARRADAGKPDAGAVRRPVQAEGYRPIRPLGVSREEMNVQDKRGALRPDAEEMRRRTEQPMLDDEDEYEEPRKSLGSRLLVIAIIVLLVIAALVLGVMMIPEDAQGPLGDFKRSVMTFIKGEEKLPAAARGLGSEVVEDVVPFESRFTVSTVNADDVRLVTQDGMVLETTMIMSGRGAKTNETQTWILMLVSSTYEGTVELQIRSGDEWLSTGLKQLIDIDLDGYLTISNIPDAPVTAEVNVPASAAPQTADSFSEPTVIPDPATDAPAVIVTGVPVTDAPVAVTETPAPATATPVVVTATPVVVTATPVVVTAPPAIMTEPIVIQPPATATPTMQVTATPTVKITMEPTPEPTEQPTPEPTPEPTPTPAPTPDPTPVPTPQLIASSSENSDPKLITASQIYVGTQKKDAYERREDDVINMPAGSAYQLANNGVYTFRGNAFRQNAAVGYVTAPSSLTQLWQAEAGGLEIKSGMLYGFGCYSQPVIINWFTEIRQAMDLEEARLRQGGMKEVIIAGQDGKIYFLDLTDGSATREAINLGFAMRSTPSIHPMGFPVMTVGQYSNKLPHKTGKTMGLYYYSLIDGEQLRLIDGLDGDRDRMYYNVGAFDTSALIDRSSNTLIAVGTNGMLYTEKLGTRFLQNDGGIFEFSDVTDQVILRSKAKGQEGVDISVESSLAMYGSYAFYADMGGVLRCVDTTTMTTIWAVNTGDAVRAAVALDLDAESGRLWLYTANTITNRTKKTGDVTIRRYDAMTGEEDWAFAVNSVRKTGKKDVRNKDVTAGAVASPVVGQNSLNGLVYFTLSSVSAEGAAKLSAGSDALGSVLIAMDKETGEVVWTMAMNKYCYSSPVAVYDEAGSGWIIQCGSDGTLYLLDGLTGSLINTLQVEGSIEGSPAVYGSTLVVGTTGKGESYIYGIAIK